MKPDKIRHPEDSAFEYIQTVRSRMINGVLLAFGFVTPVMLGISLTRAMQHGWQPIYIIHMILSVTTFGAAIFRKKLPYNVRVSLFLGIAFILGAMGLPAFGLVGGGHIILIMFAILAAIGFGTKIGMAAAALNVILMTAVAYAVCTGKLTFGFDINAYATSPSAWAAVIIDFILIVPMVVLAIGSVYSQLQTSLRSAKESHKAQKRLADNLTDSFLYRYSACGKIEYLSSVEQILGYRQGEFTSLSELLTEHQANRLAFRGEDPCQTEVKRAPFEIQVYHNDGSKRWLQLSETSVVTRDGIKTEGIAHNITHRKIRELAIENILEVFTANPGKEFHEAMIIQLAKTLECDAAFFGHFTGEKNDKIETDAFYVSGHIEPNFEYSLEGTPCAQMQDDGACIIPAGIQEIYPQSDLLKRMKIEGYAGIPLSDKSGSGVGVLVALWKERAFDEELIFQILKLFSEYTLIELERQREARKHTLLEEQLRHSQKMDAVGQLAGGIAHDFNNMLMGIMGASDLLQMRLKDDNEAKEYHRMIRNSSKRAADLTRQLLTFARKQSICRTKVDVHETITHAVALLSSTLDKRISMATTLNAIDCTIAGDPTQLQNAIMNLGINAAHAMPDGGEIRIETRTPDVHGPQDQTPMFPDAPGPCIEITVSDNGIGIPAENLNKIFEPFFTTKSLGKGTGLGLSTVLGTVQQHQGTITVESEPDQGTTFRITLPLTTADRADQVPSDELIEGSGRILLVEDEPDIQITVKEMLNQLGYDVTAADNGIQGLECFKQAKGKFDLVILDMVMPQMNGKDCFFRLKQVDPEVKVILSSGFSHQEDVQVMKAAGLNAVITKPFSSAKLSQTAMRVMQQR